MAVLAWMPIANAMSEVNAHASVTPARSDQNAGFNAHATMRMRPAACVKTIAPTAREAMTETETTSNPALVANNAQSLQRGQERGADLPARSIFASCPQGATRSLWKTETMGTMKIGQRQGRIALTGCTGFIGSTVLEHLVLANLPVSALSRRRRLHGVRAENVVAPEGLADGKALRQLLEGARSLVHAASYVGPDDVIQREVNIHGTHRLVVEAQRQGVERIIYVSTAAVYGPFPYNGAKEGELRPRPGSTLSASRARAEEIVLDAGGIVLRPHLIHGEGDRWFLGPFAAMTATLGAWVGGGSALISAIGRDDLARLVVALTATDPPDRVLHACHPDPVRIRDLAREVLLYAGVPVPDGSISPEDALAVFSPRGIRESQMRMVTRDNWLDSQRIWELTGLEPPPNQSVSPSALAWYAERFLTARR